MKIKITGKTVELLSEFTESVLNIAAAVAFRGDLEQVYITSDRDKHDLCPPVNNYWAYVRECDDTFIVLEFAYRYDNAGLCDALCLLLKARFKDEIEIIET